MRVLLIGYNDNILSGLDMTLPADSVQVLEEPDLWEGKQLAPKAAAHPCVGEIHFGRYQQDDHCLDVVAGLPRFDAVAPGMEYAVQAAARVADARGLPGAGVGAATVLRDKLLLRQATAAAGMATPEFGEIRCAQDIAEFARGRPVVVKPTGRQASLGVLLLDAGADVDKAWRECVGADEGNQLANRPMAWRYLAEERLYGPEFSTECLVDDGEVIFVNVTRKRTLPGRRPVEVGHLVPGAPADGRWRQAVKELVYAVAFGTGILHAEWVLTDDGPILIECAGRPPGDRIMDLIDLAYHTNLNDRWIRLLADEDVVVSDIATQGASIRFVIPPMGTIERIDGTAQAREAPGVHRVDLRHQPSQTISQVGSSWDRVGSVIAVADTAESAERRAAHATSLITVVTIG